MNRFPANTSDAIIQARPPGTLFSTLEVQAIVLALDSRYSAVCERLDSLSLIILSSIFMYSQECIAQQRGLCLLAASILIICGATATYQAQRVLHRSDRDSAQEVAQKQEKKLAIGRAALTQLIKGFLKRDTSDKLRRWVNTTVAADRYWLIFLLAWYTCSGTPQRLPGTRRKAAVGSTSMETLVSCDPSSMSQSS